MKNTIIVLENENYNFYKLSYKRGFKELLEEIKNRYSDMQVVNYHYGYFNPYEKEFTIDDYSFKDVDEFKLVSCVRKSNSEIYENGQLYQTYTGKAKIYKYSNLYKILYQKLDLNLFNQLKEYISIEDKISCEEKNKLLFEIFEYINFELFLSLNKIDYNKLKEKNVDKDLKFIIFNELSQYLGSNNLKYDYNNKCKKRYN